MGNAAAMLYSIVDPLRRRPIVAQIGGFRPEEGLRSWFGGRFWLPPEMEWPRQGFEPMLPILQIVSSELPRRPSALEGTAVVQVFVAQDLPAGTVANGDHFQVVLHKDSANLAPHAPPFAYKHPRSFQIHWREGEEEGPSWEEAARFVGDSTVTAFVDSSEDAFEKYGDRYERHYGTNIGGWASYIQGVDELPGEYILQIASEEKAVWAIGDNGNLYFYRNDLGQWFMEWDCY
jgi:hypothetical protein